MTPREKQLAFYEALGHAITQWQMVEADLSGVFHWVSGCRNGSVSSAIFFSALNFNVKLNMTNSAAQLSLLKKPTKLKKWNTFHSRLIRRSKVRNNIAHFMLMNEGVKGSNEIVQKLIPNIWDATRAIKYKDKPEPEYDTQALIEIARSFGRTAQDLNDFARSITPRHRKKNVPDK